MPKEAMEPKPFLAGVQEFATLYGVKPDMPAKWVHRGVLDYSQAIIVSGSPYWPLGFVCRFGQTTPRPKSLDPTALARLKETQSPGRMTFEASEVPPLAGHGEIMALFGLTKQPIVTMAAQRGRLPIPDYSLSGSPLWLLERVVEAAPRLREGARQIDWTIDEEVLAALRGRCWEGSVIKPRGVRASRGVKQPHP
ncbi:hypothetical protein [Peterkaempfera bronchialis]|uniref:Uncharacterized protein n=1 Tax=Peterkaempfera bronchialis TaxID=2126346 RepID=A0A345SXS2_9ACTN|nr:hypothetical protein [Peterkaempfera bronchialis]AXI78527.1 hypothetical protein C7M71_014910 [Peterkaempfera bronchialis]